MRAEDIAHLCWEARGGDETAPHEAQFVFLVDVADVYLATLEAMMPTDRPESPFLGGLMPIDALIEGLRDNLVFRQESGSRLASLNDE